MGSVIGDVLPLALGVAISPVPMIAVILMLLAPRARAASVAFMLGWVVGVTVVVTAVTFLVQPDGSSDPEDPSQVASVIKLVLGVLLVVLGLREWRGRPKVGEEPKLPSWMSAVDEVTAPKAGGLGVLLSGVNPKNLALCVAAGATIGGASLPTSDTIISLAVFVVIASSTVVVPVLGFLVAHERLKQPLDELRQWLTVNNATVMSVLLLVMGVVILGKGIGGL